MSRAGGTRFVGRHAELTALRAELDAALRGEGRLVALLGEPGIGKTRTATALASRGARERGGGCLGALPRQRGRTGLLAVGAGARRLRDRAAGRSERAEIAALLAGAARGTRAGGRSRGARSGPLRALRSGRRGARRAAARAQPLLIVLDDLHWADVGSLLLLEFVARELGTIPLFVLGTARDAELAHAHDTGRAARGGGASRSRSCRSPVSAAPRCAIC